MVSTLRFCNLHQLCISKIVIRDNWSIIFLSIWFISQNWRWSNCTFYWELLWHPKKKNSSNILYY